MYSMPGDYIGGGTPQEFDPSNSTITGSLSTAGINLNVSGGTSGTSWTVVIDPALTQIFQTGYYVGVQRAEFRSSGHPGLDIFGDGRGCNGDTGAFEVRDLVSSGSTITRLDLLYEQHCEGGVPALFGELRVAEPDSSGLILSSASITWPAVGLNGLGVDAPVYLRNGTTGSESVGTIAVTGAAATQFHVVDDTCSGQSVPPGGACDFFVGFKGSNHGPVSASVEIPIGPGKHAVQLDGTVAPGTTSLSMSSQPGDYVGGGLTYNFTSSDASFGFAASPSGLEANVSANDGEFWTVDMYPAAGGVLAPGRYLNATRYPFNGPGNGLSVYGDGRGCNTLTGSFAVKEVAFSAVDNSLQHFKGTFIQHCEGAAPALIGTLEYDYAPVVAPPPGVTQLVANATTHGASITWVNPSYTPYSYTVVRIETGNPIAEAPIAGRAVYQGTGTSASVTGLKSGVTYTVTVFTVDRYGNVSASVNTTVTG